METLHTEPARDQFKTESPIRAFTDWSTQGNYALGKGFRPSLAHVVPYMAAMEAKEGWRLVQILEAGTQTPSFMFRRETEPAIPRVNEMPDWTTPLFTIRKVATGLRQIAADSVAIDGGTHSDRINGYAAELEAELEITAPYVNPKRSKAAAYAGRRIDEARAMSNAMVEDDFGVEHERSYLVEDDRGMQQVAYYSAGSWWQGHNDGGPDVQTERPIVRIVPSTADLEPVDHVGRASVEVTSDEIKHDNLYAAFTGDLPTPPDGPASNEPERIIRASPALAAPYGQVDVTPVDDPVNPKHYGGTACAEIGELLTANSYQVLKYVWRLGEKDNPCVELSKALWYLEREVRRCGGHDQERRVLPSHGWVEERLKGRDQFVREVARSLISWNRYGNTATLKKLRKRLQARLDDLNGCTDWGRGLEP